MKEWNGTGTDWNTASDWTASGVPTNLDIATFDSIFSNQPSVSANVSVGAIWATTNLGQDVTIGGASTLTLVGATVNGQNNTGIYLDDVGNRNLTINAPISVNAATFTNNTSGALTVTSMSFSGAGTVTLNGNNNAGLIAITGTAGSGSIVVNTSGAVRLTGTQGHTGSTTVNAGTLDIGSGAAFSNNITTAVGTALTTTAASGTALLTNAANKSMTINGVIQDGANAKVALFKNSNTLTLTGDNSYTGGTTLGGNSTTLAIGHDHALGTGVLTTVNTNIIRSADSTDRNLVNDVAIGGNTTFGSSTTGNLKFGALSTGATILTISNAKTSFSNVAGSGRITKQGAGIIEITDDATSTFSSAFTVNDGTLLINTDLSSGSGASTVAAIAALGGDGIMGGNTTVNGTLAAGADANSTGIFSFEANLTLASTANSIFQINGLAEGTEFDSIHVGSALVYSGTLTLDFGFNATLGDTFDLFDFTSQSGTFSTINFLNAGYNGTFDKTTGLLTVTSVPEPSTYMLLGAGLAMLCFLTRRRRA